MLDLLLGIVSWLIDLIMDIFTLGHFIEKRNSQNSVVGQSDLDNEAARWQRNVIYLWVFAPIIFTLVGGGVYLWHRFYR